MGVLGGIQNTIRGIKKIPDTRDPNKPTLLRIRTSRQEHSDLEAEDGTLKIHHKQPSKTPATNCHSLAEPPDPSAMRFSTRGFGVHYFS